MTDQTLFNPAASCSLRSIRLRHGNLNISADLTAGSFKYTVNYFSPIRNKLNQEFYHFADFRTDLITDRKSLCACNFAEPWICCSKACTGVAHHIGRSCIRGACRDSCPYELPGSTA